MPDLDYFLDSTKSEFIDAVKDDIQSPPAGGGSGESASAMPPIDVLHGQVPGSSQNLVGDPAGNLDLAKAVVDHISGRSTCHDGLCVEASATYFSEALESLGVPTGKIKTMADGKSIYVKFPLVRNTQGLIIRRMSMYRLWYSNNKSDNNAWSNLPKNVRGAGAPGAIKYAGLANGEILEGTIGWPSGMLPGAVMQLWPSRADYQSVRDGSASTVQGHSPIFLKYHASDPRIIYVADNMGLNEELTYPQHYSGYKPFRFIMAANISNGRLVSSP